MCTFDRHVYSLCQDVTTATAHPAMQGAHRSKGPKQAAREYFLHRKIMRFSSGVYGFALFEECVDADPLGLARFHGVLPAYFFAVMRHLDFDECALTASCNCS